LNVLYYQQPRSTSGGVNNVGVELPKALATKINVTYFPFLAFEKDRFAQRLGIYGNFLAGKFDVVHFNIVLAWFTPMWTLVRLNKNMHCRTVLNVHGFIPSERQFYSAKRSIFDNIGFAHAQKVYQFVDKIVVNSRYMRNKIVNYYKIDPGKIVIIPNGVTLERFSGWNKSYRLAGFPSILYVGALREGKAVDVLIRALVGLKSEHPKVKLHIVGAGSSLSYLKALSVQEGIERDVIFWGQADYFSIPKFYRGADICVFPSRHEAFGIVILEAMASGKPVVASNGGGIPEIISDGENGVLVKPDDPDALAESILTLLRDGTLRNRLSHNALKTAANYSWDKIAEKYILLYKNLANSR
jgi:glycosyltransferase involved in cell wall biosynthesis